MRQPDFDNLRRILDRKTPKRPTLFEFFMNGRLYARLAGIPTCTTYGDENHSRLLMSIFAKAGYDYAPVASSAMVFPKRDPHGQKTLSMNDMSVIHDRASFEAYPWPVADQFDYGSLERLGRDLPRGMKLIVWLPWGVQENVMGLVGFENLCLMLADDPALARDIFDAVGSRLLRYVEISLGFDSVGAILVNDDWGFSTQTMLSPDQLRQYVFPWQRKMVRATHAANRPAILHSCGQLEAVMDEIIDDLGFDGKHSFEDKICPVEQAYDRWGKRIAILGGIDLDFLCRSDPAAITARSKAMLERSARTGSYALGTGNSVPEYVPDENYFAMVRAAIP